MAINAWDELSEEEQKALTFAKSAFAQRWRDNPNELPEGASIKDLVEGSSYAGWPGLKEGYTYKADGRKYPVKEIER